MSVKSFWKDKKIKPEKPKYKINGSRVPDGCKFEAFKFKFNRNRNCNKLKVISWYKLYKGSELLIST